MTRHGPEYVLTLATALILSAVWGGDARSDGPARDEFTADEIRNDQAAFFVRAEVDRTDRTYQDGDTLTLRVLASRDAHLVVLYTQADGKRYQIFPNGGSPEGRVTAGRAVEIPGPDDRFRWSVGPPFGKEVVTVIASDEPVKAVGDPALRRARFNALAPERFAALKGELDRADPAGWAEDSVEIRTVPRQPRTPSRPPRRFGVFFGVTRFRFHQERLDGTGGKHGLTLPGCDNDANLMSRLMGGPGRLDAARVRVNERATRAQMEEDVTRWLPSVSAPGDTVFIFFSTHGGQTDDDDGDEADDLDEFLLPHDFADLPVFLELLDRQHRGTPFDAQALEALKTVALDAAGAPPAGNKAGWARKVGQALIRRTGISDDTFGHWLQALDGRRVVVILDTCHSGGFASHEKGVAGPGPDDRGGPGSFDFLDRELALLKDIGQRETALLSACLTRETAITRPDLGIPLGLMTSFLVGLLQNTTGPLDLPTAHAVCDREIQRYFIDRNRRLQAAGKPTIEAHHAVLYQNLSRPVYLRP